MAVGPYVFLLLSVSLCWNICVDNVAMSTDQQARPQIPASSRKSTLSTASTASATAPTADASDKTAPPFITSFYVEEGNNLHQQSALKDLLNSSVVQMAIDKAIERLTFTCEASGFPVPKVTIKRDNISVNTTNGTCMITNPTCEYSGVYTCQAENSFSSTQAQTELQISGPTEITFTIMARVNRRNVEMECFLNDHECSEPDSLTANYSISNDVNQTIASGFANSSFEYRIENLTCSDVGAYFCRAETEDGRVFLQTAEATLDECPVQLCRSEVVPTEMSAALNETLNFSLCLISNREPSWKNLTESNRIYVNITRRYHQSIYWTADITIYNIEELDHETKTIKISNHNGSLDFQFKLNVDSPVRLCRDETDSRVISGALNKTLSFTLCVRSLEMPRWTTHNQTNKISVHFTRNETNHVNWTANITITEIDNGDNGTKSITISNKRGHVAYHFTIRVDEQELPSSPQEPRTKNGTSHLIWPPFVFVIIFVIAYIAVILYRKRTVHSNLHHLEIANSGQERQMQTELLTDTQTGDHSVFPSDFTDQDSGRMLSEEGLVYITVAQAASTNNEKSRQAKQNSDKAKQDIEDHVEYVTLDYGKTGQVVMTEIEEEISEDQKNET